MKILVIDDKSENREAAVQAFSANHEVVTVGSYDEAMDLIYQRPDFDFDMVLIDLMMPASNQALGPNSEHQRGVSMPYGFPLMVNIAKNHSKRVKYLAIVSDVNHHNHAMSASLDWLMLSERGESAVAMNGVPCWFVHARLNRDGSKNWDYALGAILSPDTVFNF